MARTILTKTCPNCGADFTVTTQNRRKTYCSPQCANQVINQGKRLDFDRDRAQELLDQGLSVIECCERLGISYSLWYHRQKEYGLYVPRRPSPVRSDGYYQYHDPRNHRRVLERHLGRKLRRKEGVHHIDGDKQHNDPSNLLLYEGERIHNEIKQTLLECGYELIRRGLIEFDKERLTYVLSESFA